MGRRTAAILSAPSSASTCEYDMPCLLRQEAGSQSPCHEPSHNVGAIFSRELRRSLFLDVVEQGRRRFEQAREAGSRCGHGLVLAERQGDDLVLGADLNLFG